MPEPISIFLSSVTTLAWVAGTRLSSGVSQESTTTQKAAIEFARVADNAADIDVNKQALFEELDKLNDECSVENWDSDGASAINGEAREIARDFIGCLPKESPMAEIGVESDGSILFEWIKAHNVRFAMSIGNTNRLAYACLNGTDKFHGVAKFDGRKIPSVILEGISIAAPKKNTESAQFVSLNTASYARQVRFAF